MSVPFHTSREDVGQPFLKRGMSEAQLLHGHRTEERSQLGRRFVRRYLRNHVVCPLPCPTDIHTLTLLPTTGRTAVVHAQKNSRRCNTFKNVMLTDILVNCGGKMGAKRQSSLEKGAPSLCERGHPRCICLGMYNVIAPLAERVLYGRSMDPASGTLVILAWLDAELDYAGGICCRVCGSRWS